MADTPNQDLIFTALYNQHVAANGRIVEFGGYALPVHYTSIMAEHNHTRTSASLFDVSHMGQVVVTGPSDAHTIAALERITPADLQTLKAGDMRYTVLLNEQGLIEDDLIITKPAEGCEPEGTFYMVVNAGRKHHDVALMRATIGTDIEIKLLEDMSLVALQGPLAAEVLARWTDVHSGLVFMQSTSATLDGIPVYISRAGYTGEDGFEISVSNDNAEALFLLLTSDERVKPAGLGARDSLRLEAGLPLYGHDMNDTIDPISAGLIFAVGKRRRTEGGFVGAAAVQKILADGVSKKRVAIRFDGKQPVREGAGIIDENASVIGNVTSGTISPTLQYPISFAYVPTALAAEGSQVTAQVRGKPITGTVVKSPFQPTRYKR